MPSFTKIGEQLTKL